MAKAGAYYYNLLNKEQQKAYHAIRSGLLEMAPFFLVPRLSGKELSDIYFMIRLDDPQIFWSVKFGYRYYEDSGNVIMSPEYLFQKKQIQTHRQAMEARVKKLAREAAKLDEKGKEQYIHDFICKNIHYDKLKKAYSHEIIGALGHGVAVCEGIAKSVKILCDALDIWCVIPISGANPEKGIKYRHAWNIVKIGGQYYHLDATFDNTLGSPDAIRYDYFNLDDKQIFRDHEPLLWRMPACTDHDHFYYKEKKLSFTKQEEVRKRVMQAAKKGKPFLFHWRGGYLTKEVLQELMVIFSEEATAKNRHACLSLNWAQAVMLLTFKDEKPEVAVKMEEANEGELYGEGEV